MWSEVWDDLLDDDAVDAYLERIKASGRNCRTPTRCGE